MSSDSSDTQSEAIPNIRNQRADRLTQKKGKRRAVDISSSDDVDLLEQAVAVMNQKNDEFDIFGQYVASELRQISAPSIQRIVKNQILQIILNAGNMVVSSVGNLQQTLIQTNTEPIIDNSQIVSFDNCQTISINDSHENQCILERYEFEL